MWVPKYCRIIGEGSLHRTSQLAQGKSLLNGTIFQMDEIPTADANGEVKEYKQTEVIEALHFGFTLRRFLRKHMPLLECQQLFVPVLGAFLCGFN